MASEIAHTSCCIAGGGPAGMMLGFLLARAGVPVVVLEKHADFLRDFRGDTVHPSTLELMHELGLLEEFLSLPHDQVDHLTAQIGDEHIEIADFSHLPTRCKFIALMPQWNFLDFLAKHAKRFPAFDLRMQSEAEEVIVEDGRVVGLRATTPSGPLEVRAELTVGADGRHSTVRRQAGLSGDDIGSPIDVLWFRISRRTGDTAETFGHVEAGAMMVMLNRSDYWQCAYVIRKGEIDAVKHEGIDAFRERVRKMSPFLADRLGEIKSFDDVKLLTVTIDRLRQWWKPGLLCIGDAAHAMSPVGGVGINLAVQDAVAAANILWAPLKSGARTDTYLASVQARRTLPMRVIQWLQVRIQNTLLCLVFTGSRPKTPLVLKVIKRFPVLRRIPARLVGLGIRPEHVGSPQAGD